MACSGVVADGDCIVSYNNLKLKHDKRYIIYAFTADNKRIVIESEGTKDKTYDDFKQALLASHEPRYAVVDFEFEHDESGAKQEKVLFIFWSPDTAPVKRKMLFASSKDAIRKPLDGVYQEIQCNDEGDLLFEEIKKKVQK
ncbi:cofilin [Perkinsus olseni]|uniref:Cofilin n=1 Tax=Perkinsus olseni TaxID=32597 RepID=A0A7J6P8F8_PEROL|nr:cofilin [Perkinsus olseni]